MRTRRPPELPTDERWAGILLFVLAAGPAWLRGGTHAPWMQYWIYVSVAVLASLIGLSWRQARRHAGPPDGRVFRGHLRDPVFWLGLLFIGLLATQWWNAGRALYFDAGSQRWAYSLPRHPSLPAAITIADARQMLTWFFPAWVILLALRSPLLSSGAVRLLWRLLVYHAGALALFGLIQYATGTALMYGRVPMQTHFFAAFGYPNHAGSYFLLILPLAAGLLSHEFAIEGRARRWARVGALGLAFFLALVGANLSLSRSAIVLSWALLIPLGGLLLAFLWPRVDPAQRVNTVVAGLAVVCLAVLLTSGLGRAGIRREFKPESDHKTLLQRETDIRLFQLRAAAGIWRDQPWFGVGGGGYRFLLAHHLRPEDWHRITTGKANVHNDPLQFLVEFGIVGAGAMAAIVLLLLLAAGKAGVGWPPLVLLPLLGAGLVWLQSLIDLPFRSPAVLYLWLICLAGASRALAPPRIPPHAS